MTILELARAKVNLTLTVVGRRADGYHELQSLITFAGVADRLVCSPNAPESIEVTGPFAGSLIGDNILRRTLSVLANGHPLLRLGSVQLEKNLPVAAGLGGGSADAAALLRAVRRANSDRYDTVAWNELATELGADVPVCFANRPAMLSGIGERIAPLSGGSLPAMPAVLVNPRVPLRTDAVFRALTAPAAAPNGYAPAMPDKFRDIADVLDFMRARGNDLEHPATTLLPLIHKIKTILANLPGCRLAAMSGSGPTCFGIFGNEDEAARAATLVQAAEREWWVAATLLAGS